MTISQHRLLQVLAVSAVALGLSACGPSGNQSTVGEKIDGAINQTEQAADDATKQAERAMDAATQHMEHAVDATHNAVDTIMEAAGDAGITAKVNAVLLADPELSALRIQVDTKDGAVTLQGEALNPAAKDRATELVKAVAGVHTVDNQLRVQ